jgi:hypothetical protein
VAPGLSTTLDLVPAIRIPFLFSFYLRISIMQTTLPALFSVCREFDQADITSDNTPVVALRLLTDEEIQTVAGGITFNYTDF